jgi:protein-tyrosine-phosphatase
MAEAVFKQLIKAEKENLENWCVQSAGIHAWGDLPAVPLAQEACQLAGYDINSHLSKPLTNEILNEFNLTLVMEIWHLQQIREIFPNHAHKTFLLSEMTNGKSDIIDPYGSPLINHQKTLEEIKGYLTKGFTRIVKLSSR